jgi:hypothetical protein
LAPRNAAVSGGLIVQAKSRSVDSLRTNVKKPTLVTSRTAT